VNLVTGASGFAGAALVRRLLAAGAPVRILVRSRARLPADLAGAAARGELEVCEGDLLALDSLPRAVEGCRRVFHCAGLRPDGPEEDQLPAHGAATHNLLLTCRAREVERVVLVSCLSVLLPPDVRDAHAAAKKVQEEVAADFHRHGLDTVIVRSAPLFGPGSDSVVNGFADAVLRGRLGSLPPWAEHPVSCTFVDDLAAALQKAADVAPPRAVYDLASEVVPLHALVARIEAVAAREGLRESRRGWRGVLARALRSMPAVPPAWRHGIVPPDDGARIQLKLAHPDTEAAWAETVRWLVSRSG